MKKIIAAALLSFAAVMFVAGTVSIAGSATALAGGKDDGANHDKGDDRGGRGR